MAKKTKKVASETLVNFILDKSGSMQSLHLGTISGFNEYVDKLSKDGNKYSFSFTLFDTVVEKRYINVPIKDVKPLDNATYFPSGMTALYDAVCQTCNEVKKSLKPSQKVLTVILTDGQENSSREFGQADMNNMVKELEGTGKWTFVFLGANQDSFATGGAVGVSSMNTTNFQASNEGMAKAMCAMSVNTRSFGASSLGATNAFFSKSDQMDIGGVSASASSNMSTSGDEQIKAHFSALGKKSWEKRKRDLQG